MLLLRRTNGLVFDLAKLASLEAITREMDDLPWLDPAVDNLSALAFYKRHGYSVFETVPRYYSNGVDALRMKKPLETTT